LKLKRIVREGKEGEVPALVREGTRQYAGKVRIELVSMSPQKGK